MTSNKLKSFDDSLKESSLSPLAASGITVFQINLGRLCNQACRHCHVEAGPERKEVMSEQTMKLCLNAVANSDIPTIDITGGAPEMNPCFCWLVEEMIGLGRRVMVRTNLTILAEPEYRYMPEFYARNSVEIVASLPHYSEQATDRQRGNGVFKKSIEAIVMLNSMGYGREGSGLVLNLAYNSGGAFLPPSQKAVEQDFKTDLFKKYGITFNNLYTITNMPIGRFLNYLNISGNYSAYMARLVSSYNPAAASQVMCRYTLSVGWDGSLYDCDFNQMLGMKTNHGAPFHISDFDPEQLSTRKIVTGIHCYGCTAGAGSSCGGAVA